MDSGVLCLVQLTKCINSDVYKLGSAQNITECIKKYGNDSKYICIMDCPNYKLAKKLIISILVKRYNLTDSATYFEAKQQDILRIFLNIVDEFKKDQLRRERNNWLINELIIWMSNSDNPEVKKYFAIEEFVKNNMNNYSYVYKHVLHYVGHLAQMYFELYHEQMQIKDTDINILNVMTITEQLIQNIKSDYLNDLVMR